MNNTVDEIKSLLVSNYEEELRTKGEVTKEFFDSIKLREKTKDTLKVLFPFKFGGIQFDLTDEDYESKYQLALRQVRSNFVTTISSSNSLQDSHKKSWLTEQRIEELEWNNEDAVSKYRNRYLKYLKVIGRSDAIITETKESSLKIIQKIGNPKSNSDFFVKGLVVGSVQSGKTSNFNAVINSCIDTGYRLIIVLSGLMEDLRQQTQIRIEKEVEGKMIKEGEFIGVGKIAPYGQGDYDQVNQIIVPTSIHVDFNRNMQKQDFNLNQVNVLICKKNTSVLQNLLLWLNDNLKEDAEKLNLPFIIVDDEADNASLNNAGYKGAEYATKINGHIRALLALFRRKTYIGYTATPFANILQDYNSVPEKKWEISDRRKNEIVELDLVDNLFPSDFIELLNPPSNYIGPKNFFETRIDEVTKIDPLIAEPIREHIEFFPERINSKTGEGVKKYSNKYEFEGDPNAVSKYDTIKDYRSTTQATKKDDNFPIAIPQSLQEAVKCYIIGIAVRLHRRPQLIELPYFQPHNSMLIHISRYSNWQCRTKELIVTFVEDLQRRINNDPLSGTDSIYEEFERIWNKYFLFSMGNLKTYLPEGYEDDFLTPLTFVDIKGLLPTAVKDIDVKAVNTVAKDSLDYSSGEKKYIVIGGNKLSRGYTLEGLTINYFVRGTNLADTLLQMGRWFGYRPGYLDCCKLFTTKDSLERFDLVTWTIEELEKDFKSMSKDDKRPIDFANKVLTHPGVIQITRAPILKNANLIKGSYSDKIIQTTELKMDKDLLESSWKSFRTVYSEFSKEFEHIDNQPFITLKTDVDGLKKFINTAKNITSTFDRQSVLKYIELCNKKDYLTNWTIGIRIKGSENTYTIPAENSGFLKDVQLTKRKGASEGRFYTKLKEENIFRVSGNSSNIRTSSEDLSITLTTTQKKAAQKKWDDDQSNKGKSRPEHIYRKLIPKTDGLLLFYLMDVKEIYNDIENDLDHTIPLIGFAIGIPPLDDTIGDDYLINDQILEQIRLAEQNSEKDGNDEDESDELIGVIEGDE